MAGTPATPQEIAGWNIDVRPDGQGLAGGRSLAEQGQAIYDEKCASCHCASASRTATCSSRAAWARSARTSQTRTTGSKLEYATTLWDYINRAMPFNAPQTLKPDEVYALTAYVLNLNDIVPADAVLDQDSLPKLVMPNRNGFTTKHGFMARDGKPDTHNTAHERPRQGCGRRRSFRTTRAPSTATCSRRVPVGSGARTDLARASAAGRGHGGEGFSTLPASACTACHGVSEKIVGPGFREIAARYAGDGGAEARLAAKVKSGGSGAWGTTPMPPQPQVKDADARALVQWILAGAK